MGPFNTAVLELTRQHPLVPGSRLSLKRRFGHGSLSADYSSNPGKSATPTNGQSPAKRRSGSIALARPTQIVYLQRNPQITANKYLLPGNPGRTILPNRVPSSNRGTISSRNQAITRTRIRHSTVRVLIITRVITTTGARPHRHAPPGRLEASKEPRAGREEQSVYHGCRSVTLSYDGPASVSSIPSGMTKSAAAAIVFL